MQTYCLKSGVFILESESGSSTGKSPTSNYLQWKSHEPARLGTCPLSPIRWALSVTLPKKIFGNLINGWMLWHCHLSCPKFILWGWLNNPPNEIKLFRLHAMVKQSSHWTFTFVIRKGKKSMLEFQQVFTFWDPKRPDKCFLKRHVWMRSKVYLGAYPFLSKFYQIV